MQKQSLEKVENQIMELRTLVIVLTSTVFAASGQLFLKIGSHGQHHLDGFINFANLSGLLCYVVGALLWMISLSRAPLYAVYPFTILTFILVGFGSMALLSELPSVRSVTGWLVILIGLIITVTELPR